jgi:hypothetical protein
VTIGLPPTLTRAAFVDLRTGYLTREGALFLDGLRSALGGDKATITPNDAVGALAPVAALMTAAVDLWPVPAAASVATDLAPVAVCDGGADLAPVAIPEMGALP